MEAFGGAVLPYRHTHQWYISVQKTLLLKKWLSRRYTHSHRPRPALRSSICLFLIYALFWILSQHWAPSVQLTVTGTLTGDRGKRFFPSVALFLLHAAVTYRAAFSAAASLQHFHTCQYHLTDNPPKLKSMHWYTLISSLIISQGWARSVALCGLPVNDKPGTW